MFTEPGKTAPVIRVSTGVFRESASRIRSDNQIHTSSLDGQWNWTWTFTDSTATLDVQFVDPESHYWFLYEGIPGGRYDPDSSFWGNDSKGPLRTTPDYLAGEATTGTWQWAYFGHDETNHVLLALQHQADSLNDLFAYMGAGEPGLEADTGMVVFGFGREQDAQPLLSEPGLRFTVSLLEVAADSAGSHRQIAETAREMIARSR